MLPSQGDLGIFYWRVEEGGRGEEWKRGEEVLPAIAMHRMKAAAAAASLIAALAPVAVAS